MQKKLLLLVALPCLFAVSACQQRDRETTRMRTERSAERMPTYDNNAASKYARGEGEREHLGILDNNGADKVPDATVIAAYAKAITEDPVLAREAGSTRIAVEDGDLVLRGAVATRGMSDALEDLAKKIAADREIDNELTVTGTDAK